MGNYIGAAYGLRRRRRRVKKTTPAGTTRYIGKLTRNAPTAPASRTCSRAISFLCDLATAGEGGAPDPHNPNYPLPHRPPGQRLLVTDGTGNKLEEITYMPFGEIFSTTEPPPPTEITPARI